MFYYWSILLEHELSWEKLSEWTRADKMRKVEVEVSLPKFKLEEKYDLKDTLSSLGMSDAFSQGAANFSGMSDSNNLYLSKVFHKAFVEVNEEGTEATAATAATVLFKMATMASTSLEDKMEDLSAANSGFSFKLYKELAKSNLYNNIIFSPFSISAALSMVYVGARGNTAAQMGETLLFNKVGRSESSAPRSPPPAPLVMEQKVQKAPHHIPVPKRAHHDDEDITRSILPAYKALTSEISKANNNYTLESASNIFVEKSYQAKKEYVNDIRKHFGVEPQNVNFVHDAENSRKKINSWVGDKTKKKIKELVPVGTLKPSTVMVLVNAIYFKGNWTHKFNVEHTQEKQFRLSKSSSKPVQMMFQKAKFNIGLAELHGITINILELPYGNGDLSMMILLPDDIHDNSTGLQKLERELSWEKLSEWTRADKMRNVEVEVSLPKFKLEEKYDLKDTLSSLGMSDAFRQGAADFSGMSDSKDLYLSKVFHKAYVEVNEEGTEATAAIASGMRISSTPIKLYFMADHPFVFAVQHKKTNSILFLGRFSSP